jgi:hypothetical protein
MEVSIERRRIEAQLPGSRDPKDNPPRRAGMGKEEFLSSAIFALATA